MKTMPQTSPTFPPDWQEILACPQCHGSLDFKESAVRLLCHACGVAYPVEEGIPVMLIDRALPLTQGRQP